MGNTKNILEEITKISDIKPYLLDAKGIVIATFSSVADPKELTDYFKQNSRNFLIFDLNSENSGFNFIKDDINEGLFGFLKYMDDNMLKEKTNSLIHEISSTTVTNISQKITQFDEKEVHITLEQQLQNAVDNEDYELAIELTKTIKKLAKNVKKSP